MLTNSLSGLTARISIEKLVTYRKECTQGPDVPTSSKILVRNVNPEWDFRIQNVSLEFVIYNSEMEVNAPHPWTREEEITLVEAWITIVDGMVVIFLPHLICLSPGSHNNCPRNRHNRKGNCGVLGDLSFLVLMDTNQLTKEEILLLTRYYLDDFRRSEIFKRSADKFAREAKIDETQPLVGTLWEYNELCWKECRDLDYWTYFCDKKLKTLRGNTFQSNALTNTTTNQQHLSVDRSGIEVFNFPSVIFGSSRDYLLIWI
ncbi:unnamed protein product [Lactuca virosa]|uniref:C2 domain-containing protein n=1 Tax=Lactuca virosa TaxID=75947 RepID=A0AAU9NQK4_9ASTR|nr:unnamed protein product [Lactuca virosa]